MAEFDDFKAAGEAFLAHHGVEGQQWGVQNGPPYPLEGKGKKNFIQQRKEVRAAKRRKKILKDPKKLAKYSDEFTPEEIAEALKKIDAVEDIKKRIPKKGKLTRAEKRKAKDPATLSKNIDKFDSDTFKMALDRLQKQRDAWDMAIKDAKRPADILNVGNTYLNEITSGISKLKSGTGDIIGLHDNFMLLGKNGKKLSDQYADNYPKANSTKGLTDKDVEDLLKKYNLI